MDDALLSTAPRELGLELKMTTLLNLIESIEDNNRINDGSWVDWKDMAHVESVYGTLSDEDVSRERAEMIIANAINTNGNSLRSDLQKLELEVFGQNFSGSFYDCA